MVNIPRLNNNLQEVTMKRLPHPLFGLLAILLVQTGCSSSVLQLRDQLDLHRGEFRQKLADKKELTTKFLACTRQAYDEPLSEQHDVGTSAEPPSLKTPEGQATSVHPLSSVIDRARQRHHDKGDSLSIIADVLDDLANDKTPRIDLDKLKQVINVSERWHGHLGLDEDQLERDSSRFARLLLTYNKAYFGDLSFTAKPDIAGAGLRGVVKVTSKGFIDRSGNSLLFPGISAEIDISLTNSVRISATAVDSQRISADLTRIFLEAIFDTAFRVPAVHGATALRVGSNTQESPYPEFDANHPAIPMEALARVTRDAMRAEAAVTSLVGKTVRGGSVFSIQNETLAASLETAAGVMAKKLIEHEGFCYFQVTQGS
jgi:hypothetical protein